MAKQSLVITSIDISGRGLSRSSCALSCLELSESSISYVSEKEQAQRRLPASCQESTIFWSYATTCFSRLGTLSHLRQCRCRTMQNILPRFWRHASYRSLSPQMPNLPKIRFVLEVYRKVPLSERQRYFRNKERNCGGESALCTRGIAFLFLMHILYCICSSAANFCRTKKQPVIWLLLYTTNQNHLLCLRCLYPAFQLPAFPMLRQSRLRGSHFHLDLPAFLFLLLHRT